MTPPTSPSPRFNLRWLLLILVPLLSIIAALLTFTLTEDNSRRVSSGPVITATPYVHPLIDKMAPNFELPALTGETVRLSNFRGQVVFVNMWATWCQPCRREFPAFEAFSAQQTDVVVLAVDQGDSASGIQTFLDEVGAHHIQVLLDKDLQVSSLYTADFLPSTFVIDQSGRVAAFHLGEITLDDLKRYAAGFGA